MPTSERLSKGGLRYNQMHTTALCSPTRAALLTGRNHHSVNMGVITEFGTSWPGATGMRPNTCSTIAEMLKLNGYNTGYFGKSHETPAWELSVSGPYDRWPTGSGFEKFYGFLGGEMNQFVPLLFDGTTRVDPPKTPQQGYHLSDDITDKAIGWIRAEHTDWNVGRLVDALEQLGVMENTLLFYQLGDNGMSAEGGLIGTHNSILNYNGLDPTIAEMKTSLNEIGTVASDPHIPVGFAHAGNCPFQWTKQVASHYGGTRNGLIVHWPKGIKARGEIRSQWHHVIDIVPTILEVTGLPEPVMVNGVPQRPIEGVSMAYTFGDGKAASRRTLQYFEMFGNRGIYHDGWTAVTKHRTPWLTGQIKTVPFNDDVWELYDTRKDFSQSENLAARHPDKLAEMRALFLVEAAKYQVFPLDDRTFERANALLAGRPDLMVGRKTMKLYGGMRLMGTCAPNLYNTTFTVTADIDSTDGKAMVIGRSRYRSIGFDAQQRKGTVWRTRHLNEIDRTPAAPQASCRGPISI